MIKRNDTSGRTVNRKENESPDDMIIMSVTDWNSIVERLKTSEGGQRVDSTHQAGAKAPMPVDNYPPAMAKSNSK